MHLTAELFQQVIGAIRAGRRRTNDGRRLARVGVAFRLDLRLVSASSAPRALSAHLRDISPAGMGFVCDCPLRVGERIVAMLPRKPSKPLLIFAIVKCCQRLEHRVYRVGARFVADSDGTDYGRRAIEVRNAVPI